MLLIASCLIRVYKSSGLLNPLGIRKSKDKSNKTKNETCSPGFKMKFP